MKKILSVILAVVMIASLATCFALNSSAETTADKTIFKVYKTSKAPTLDGKKDSLYGKEIFSLKGSDIWHDEKQDSKIDYRGPLGYNSDTTRYDSKEHPKRTDSDWWNCKITGYAAWDDTYLYFLMTVENGGKLDDNKNAIWYGDGMQLSVYSKATTEYTFAKNGNGLAAVLNVGENLSLMAKKQYAYGPSKLPTGGVYTIDSNTYAYEFALDWKALGIDPAKTQKFGFNASINMNDANMDQPAFCGFQVTYGIFNEPDKTKTGMAFAAKMNLLENNSPNPNSETEPKPKPNPEPKPEPNPEPKPEPKPEPTPTGFKAEIENSLVVEAEAGVFPAGTTLSAATITEGEVFDSVSAALADTASKFTAYDITAKNADAEVSPTGVVKATFTIPDGYDREKLSLVYIDAEGKTETIAYELNEENNTMTAELSHLSTYAVIEVKEEDVNDNPQTPVEPETPKDPEPSENNNNGGSLLWLWIVIGVVVVLAAAAVCVYFFVLKKDLSKLKNLFSKNKK